MSKFFDAAQRFFYLMGRSLRETGQAIERIGYGVKGESISQEELCRHRRIMSLYNAHPKISNDTFIAPSASVIGAVNIGPGSSIWYGSVVKSDNNLPEGDPEEESDKEREKRYPKGLININSYSNVQDRAVITTSLNRDVDIGSYVTIGHSATLRGCTIKDEAIIGMGSLIDEGAIVEKRSIVAAGAVVAPGTIVGTGELWAGVPAKKHRDLTEKELSGIVPQAEDYSALSKKHADEFIATNTSYRELLAMKPNIEENTKDSNSPESTK